MHAYRPIHHFAPPANWLSDPNGLVWLRGEWHLFYQHNPFGEDWGHMSWGHAVSTDLVTWRDLPVALAEDETAAIFSGSAVLDVGGSAGFGSGAMVAIYTAAVSGNPPRQTQCLAGSADGGLTWTKHPANPVLDRGLVDFRDPNVIWHEPTRRWIMVVALSAEQRAVLYGSADLVEWEELSVITGEGAPGAVWECPLLIDLPVEGTELRRWLFKIDVLCGGPGSGTLYQTGTFDGIRFEPDRDEAGVIWNVADWGADFYAAIAWHAPRDVAGRPAWIGWMGNHAYQASLPCQGWRGVMSLPRRISLALCDGRFGLMQQVEPAAAAQFARLDWGTPQIPVVGSLNLPRRECRFSFSDASGRFLTLERLDRRIIMQRIDPVTPALNHTAYLDCSDADQFTLWLDHGSAELLSACGTQALTVQHRLAGTHCAASWS